MTLRTNRIQYFFHTGQICGPTVVLWTIFLNPTLMLRSGPTVGQTVPPEVWLSASPPEFGFLAALQIKAILAVLAFWQVFFGLSVYRKTEANPAVNFSTHQTLKCLLCTLVFMMLM